MMGLSEYVIRPIGHVESTLTDPKVAPKQGDEGAPDARIVIAAQYRPALDGLETGTDVVLLTWLDRADRNLLTVHPRDDSANPLRGVFATRSADRPNPIGLHQARILAIDGTGLTLQGIEAIDGTPVLDIKPVLVGRNSL